MSAPPSLVFLGMISNTYYNTFSDRSFPYKMEKNPFGGGEYNLETN